MSKLFDLDQESVLGSPLHAVIENELFGLEVDDDEGIVEFLVVDHEGQDRVWGQCGQGLRLSVQVVSEMHEVVGCLELFPGRRECVPQEMLQLEEEQGVEQVKLHARIIRIRGSLSFE